MKFTEDELRAAAVEARRYMLSQLPDEDSCQHCFSEQFEQDMETLRRKVRANQVAQKQAFLGWPYYARRGIAAVLLCFVLACFTMPETVLAGYRYLIEVIETVWDEYTEFRYHSDASADTEFQPLELQYLPEGMEEVRREERNNGVNAVYENNEKGYYIDIYQRLLTEEYSMNAIMDTEDIGIKTLNIQNGNIKLVFKREQIYFYNIRDEYYINGRTNLTQEDIVKILNNISF
ncbi:MAG: DUF4367 domain-containing protein [Peptococcaceae bacterium]